jgi:hypothetical protein
VNGKEPDYRFDMFLDHNSKDKPTEEDIEKRMEDEEKRYTKEQLRSD